MTKQKQAQLRRITQHVFWRGRISAWRGIVLLGWVTIRLFAAQWLWGTAIRLAHFPDTSKNVAAILALVTAALFLWTCFDLFWTLIKFGLKRCLILGMILIVGMLGFDALTISPNEDRLSQIESRLTRRTEIVGSSIREGMLSIIKAPEEFSFAYTGIRAAPQLPIGFPTPDPAATPVVMIARRASEALLPPATPKPEPTPTERTPEQSEIREIRVGSAVRVVDTIDEPLRAHIEPSTTSKTVYRFRAGTPLEIMDGPRTADGYTWWLVRDTEGQEGWCAEVWLEVSQ